MPQCKHEDFGAHCSFSRVMPKDSDEAIGFQVGVKVWCKQCNQPFDFGNEIANVKDDGSVDDTELIFSIFPHVEGEVLDSEIDPENPPRKPARKM